MNRKQGWIWLAVVFQIGAVAAMATSREWLLATGEPYVFQTAPVDPRDIFRGDYVRLEYLFSRVSPSQLAEEIRENGLAKGQKVYLSLVTDGNGVSHGGRLSAAAPAGEAYLAGRSTEHWPYWRYRKTPPERRPEETHMPVSVKYGIEQYYVQQGTGREMEDIRGGRDGYQVPLLIHARVSGAGEAAIRSYEWGNLATKTEIARSPEREAPDDQASASIRLTLLNRSDQPLILPFRTDNCSFILIPAQWAPALAEDFVDEERACEHAEVEQFTLAPGETHAMVFDLNDPRWRVLYNNKPTPPGKLPWSYRYRIIYQGETIPGANATILSRAFHGGGNVD